ncbi:MAG: M23 family metallopeptidase [Bacteroidota bacterium]
MKYFLLLSVLFCLSCGPSELPDQKALASMKLQPAPPRPPQVRGFHNPKLRSRRLRRDSSGTDLFPTLPLQQYDSIFRHHFTYCSDGFDYPVGKPDAQHYFLAQQFGENSHLGEDWNGTGGGNTDLGDPVYVVGNGLVTFAKEVCCGWGNVIRVVHRLPNHPEYDYVESVYAHLNNIQIQTGDLLRRGDQIGTIGTANGRYWAHLHLELRSFINMSLGPGYSEDRYGYLAPSDFIAKHRP